MTREEQDPGEAMQVGVRALLKRHYPDVLVMSHDCTCGTRLTEDYEWSDHVASIIVAEFPPATLEVTDHQARIDELIGEMEEWVAGRRSMWNSFAAGSADDAIKQAGCAITDAVEILKRSMLLQTLVAAVKIGV